MNTRSLVAVLTQKLGEPPGSPRPLPLVRFAYKALRAFPTPSTVIGLSAYD